MSSDQQWNAMNLCDSHDLSPTKPSKTMYMVQGTMQPTKNALWQKNNYPRSLNLRCVTSLCCGWFHVVCLSPIAIPMADCSSIRIISIQRDFSDWTKFRFISDLRTHNPWRTHGTIVYLPTFKWLILIKYGAGKYTTLFPWESIIRNPSTPPPRPPKKSEPRKKKKLLLSTKYCLFNRDLNFNGLWNNP